MRYQDPQLRHLLAGEYALGALHGAARVRFETLLHHDPDLRRRVVEWQERLTALDEATPAVTPPRRVFDNLQRRLSPGTEPRPTWWQRLGFWRPAAAASMALAAVLAVFVAYQRPVTPPPADPLYVGVLTDTADRPAIALLAYNEPFRLVIESREPLTAGPGQVLRVWIVDRETGETRFLARVANGGRTIPLSQTQWDMLSAARALEVSRDPADSPRAEPVGEILYSGICVSLKRWKQQD